MEWKDAEDEPGRNVERGHKVGMRQEDGGRKGGGGSL